MPKPFELTSYADDEGPLFNPPPEQPEEDFDGDYDFDIAEGYGDEDGTDAEP